MTTIPFVVNIDAKLFRDRYPELRTGAFIRNIVIGNTNYTVKIMPNFFMENIEISILDIVGNNIITCLPFVESEVVDYLIGSNDFNNYVMNYNFTHQQFEIKEKVS